MSREHWGIRPAHREHSGTIDGNLDMGTIRFSTESFKKNLAGGGSEFHPTIIQGSHGRKYVRILHAGVILGRFFTCGDRPRFYLWAAVQIAADVISSNPHNHIPILSVRFPF